MTDNLPPGSLLSLRETPPHRSSPFRACGGAHAPQTAQAATAATAPPKALLAAAIVAGKPVDIVCDADVNLSPAPTPPGFTVAAWTPYGGNVIHALPSICDDANSPIGGLPFALALGTFVHEAAHARGVRREACAELTADIGVYDVLRQVYGVSFFTPLSWLIGRQVLAATRQLPADYQPEGCTVYG